VCEGKVEDISRYWIALRIREDTGIRMKKKKKKEN
jgi:hypothetical protein